VSARPKTKAMSDRARRYPVNVFWSDEDGGFIATAPDLPGSSAFGDSQTEALAQIEHAIEAWIEAANAAGNPIPEPSRPEAQSSGRILLRMPKSLHAELARSAKYENVSLNHYAVFLLTQALSYRSSTRDFVRSWWVQTIGADFTGQNITIPRAIQRVSLSQPTTSAIITSEKVIERVGG
jgi:predicted RNase H-like HicB family nuclease